LDRRFQRSSKESVMTTKRTRAEPPWTEHLARAAESLAGELRRSVPGEFSDHARGSLREALLAVRSLLDRGIERLAEDERQAKPRKVEVE
jgi:hypothetical protein